MDRETKEFILKEIDHEGFDCLLNCLNLNENETDFVEYLRDELNSVLNLIRQIEQFGFDSVLLSGARAEKHEIAIAKHLRGYLHQIAEDAYKLA